MRLRDYGLISDCRVEFDSVADRIEVLDLWDQGATVDEISECLEVPDNVVREYLRDARISAPRARRCRSR